MPCTLPPAACVAVVVQVKSASPLQVVFTPGNAAAKAVLVNSAGDLDFSGFETPVDVTFKIAPAAYDFWGDASRRCLIYSEHASGADKHAVKRGDHQFGKGVDGCGRTKIHFVYNNDLHCAAGSDVCRQSRYGFYIGKGPEYLGTIDPTINNGGNSQ